MLWSRPCHRLHAMPARLDGSCAADMARVLSGDRSGLKAKIKVPRLNGGRMGVFATRAPHRPVPLGLSTAQVIAVKVGRACRVPRSASKRQHREAL